MDPGERSPADGAPDNTRPPSGRHQGPHRAQRVPERP